MIAIGAPPTRWRLRLATHGRLLLGGWPTTVGCDLAVARRRAIHGLDSVERAAARLGAGRDRIVLGGVVRGFGGFGASMVWVIGSSLVLPPSSAIPTAFVLEVLASVQLLPGVWRQVHWRSLRWRWPAP